ncbi:glycoside hydrolase family 127 protein [Arenibacter sp. M-2]|uniref:glycoside hydrolase family 127 protein n=1 Tax=Arenibacter sp. M-2 TaxID=3053612 RepID=UPI002570D348|nr:beta-L-arabinofuranosidase domain-containing protein [Arenibacter sp. M-2]MDL5512286.1 glycoside hydrolase family 127 protein [Arenibacter sp. M-2]
MEFSKNPNFFYLIRYAIFSLVFCAKGFCQQPISYYPIKPVRFTKVKVTDSFWKEKIGTNREVTIPIAFQRSEESGRIKNFTVAAGLESGTFNTSRGYDDSDVYKVMEGAAYSLSQEPNSNLEEYLDSLITLVGKAQEDDGYLYTVKTILGISNAHRDAKYPKWERVEYDSHELYNAGHMYEAAVAHYYATGSKKFLDIAVKNADLINREFGWGKREMVPGHQEIEIGLTKLYEATGQKKYLDLAKFFLDKRGENSHKSTYNQSHKKVTQQEKALGHSVRAAYMYTAMADMAALTQDVDYVKAMDRLWHDIVDTKLYIIGGIGSASGHEGFGDEYELPNLSAYNETCAAIANVFWNYRLFLTHGNAKYVDVLERSMYNNVLSGVSLEGDKFFYPNRLESRGHIARSEWFETSCCPSNLARFIPDIPGYIYAQDDNSIYVNLFISSETDLTIKGQTIGIKQTSQLPWSGNVDISLETTSSIELPLRIRIPGWATEKPVPSDLYTFGKPLTDKTKIFINEEEFQYDLDNGYAVINHTWNPGDKIRVEFPFTVRTVISHNRIEENRGKFALQLGPMVYCIEGWDLPNGHSNHIIIDKNQEFKFSFEKDLLKGVMTVKGEADHLYITDSGDTKRESINFKAIPYYAWANRGPAEMEVWIPYSAHFVTPLAYPKKSHLAVLSTSKTEGLRNLNSVNDSYIPDKSSNDKVTAFDFWPMKNSTEWIVMDFDEPQTISNATVFWKNGDEGRIILPKSWKLYYWAEDTWKAVGLRKYTIEEDGQPSTIAFKEVTSMAFKLEIEMADKPAGLYEFELN